MRYAMFHVEHRDGLGFAGGCRSSLCGPIVGGHPKARACRHCYEIPSAARAVYTEGMYTWRVGEDYLLHLVAQRPNEGGRRSAACDVQHGIWCIDHDPHHGPRFALCETCVNVAAEHPQAPWPPPAHTGVATLTG